MKGGNVPRPYGNDLRAPLHLLTTEEQREAVEKAAKSQGVSIGQLVRDAIDQHVQKSGNALSSEAEAEIFEQCRPLGEQLEQAAENKRAIAKAALGLHDRLDSVEDEMERQASR